MKYDRIDSLFEGFENRIAIGDLEDKVKSEVIKGLNAEFGISGPGNKVIGDEIGTVYFDIDSLEVESDGSVETIADLLGASPEDLAASISAMLKKMPKRDIGKYEAANEAESVIPTRVDWTEVGKEYVRTPEDKAKIEKNMEKLKWEELTPGKSVGFSQGMAIKHAIKEFRLPKVDMIAIGGGFGLSREQTASYGFYGIQANYKDSRIRVYILDSGVECTPIAVEVFEKKA